MKNVLSRLWDLAVNEPVAVRAVVAAAINVLVLSGAVPAPFSDTVDTVVGAVLLVVANVAALLSARSKVEPLAKQHP